jgi:hypothetical protein
MAGFSAGTLVLDSNPFVTSSGDNNDVPLGGSLMYIVVSNDMDAITGMAGDVTLGSIIFVVNIGPTNNLVIKNNNVSSSAGNRILTVAGIDLTVPPFCTALLGYDTTNQEWHVTRFSS